MSTLFSEKSIGRAIFVRIGLMLITQPIKVLVYSPINACNLGVWDVAIAGCMSLVSI